MEAQFLGLKDGKINLHKMNGVKIAVPVAKMSVEDLEYVERATGISLDEDKPLSGLRKKMAPDSIRSPTSASSKVGASVEPKKPDYDWFQFFLSCDVAVGLCERYAQAFSRDSMDESVLPDVDASVLRNLGLREGDIIKVMRFLDNKYARGKKGAGGEDGEAGGGLFSGPGGTLRNNTRKGRPAPAVQTNDVVDPKAFSRQKDANSDVASPSSATAPAASAAPASKSSGGFDDDAWDVKPSKTQPSEAPSTTSAAPASRPAAQLTSSMQDLSLLSQPLEPTKVQPVVTQPPAAPPTVTTSPPAQVPQQTGATPAFFSGMQPPTINTQQLGQMPQAMARQRPMAPQHTQGQGALMPPPPLRPLSAPQSAQPSAFSPPPLQPQMTGNPNMYQQQIAPPGQSLNDINQARLQQQYMQQMQQQQQLQAAQQPPAAPMMAYPTGMQQPGFGQNQFMQPMANGPQQMQSPFADPRSQQFSPVQAQPTGYPGVFNPGQGFGGAPTGGVNSFLPPPMEPQRTGMPGQMQPQATGMPFTQGFGNTGAPPQQQQQQQQAPMQPLVAQKTGPPPPVRFGMTGDAKLAPQPTGRRANLAHASKLLVPSCLPTYLSTHVAIPITWRVVHLANRNHSTAEPLWILRSPNLVYGAA